MRKQGICVCFVLLAMCFCAAASAHGHSLIVMPQELTELLKSGAGMFVDLRPEKEYNKMHIPGFVSVPYDEVDVLTLADAQEPIYLICTAGRTSAMAYNQLLEAGVQDVHSVVFGVEEYAEAIGMENMEGADICVPCILLQKALEDQVAEDEESKEDTAAEAAEIEQSEEEDA